ncbi:YfhE family protein [Bacillus niameyensis]|nr:YfhE family protein [Bacillus niameyensis]
MSKNKKNETKSTLSTTQEVLYAKEFKRADKAGGYTDYLRKGKG